MKKAIAGITLLACLFTPLHAAMGQSAVITLVMPYGARSEAMGEVGTALVDDESVLYFNPAGLDVPNDRWYGGAGTWFYQPLLPAFELNNLWQAGVAATFQDSSSLMGAPGLFINRVNMGGNTVSNELGQDIGSLQSYEAVVAVGWGFDLKELGIKNHYFGITLKGFESALATGYEGGTARSFAVDLGYLWTINDNFRFGATLMNMGPAVWYTDPDDRDPIPFTINLALAYKNRFTDLDLPFPCAVEGECRLDREIVTNNGDGNPPSFLQAIWSDWLHDTAQGETTVAEQLQEFVEHLGGELSFYNTLSLRMGYLIDITGQRYERHWGFGVNIFNHFTFDFSEIYSPEEYIPWIVQTFDPNLQGSSGARDKQWQISLTLTRALMWKESDWEWWKVK
jgi:hypothetical protein